MFQRLGKRDLNIDIVQDAKINTNMGVTDRNRNIIIVKISSSIVNSKVKINIDQSKEFTITHYIS